MLRERRLRENQATANPFSEHEPILLYQKQGTGSRARSETKKLFLVESDPSLETSSLQELKLD